MDSRLIYKTTEHLKHKISWIKPGETEWIYCGSAGEVKFDVIKTEFTTFFNSDRFYVVTTRSDSYQAFGATIFNTIKDKVGLIDFSIWNKDLSKVVEFNKIGVFRKGTVAAKQ